MTTLYEKRGRKYIPVSERWYGEDEMKVGEFRLTYCYQDGGKRYNYNVTPATASFVAAAMIARTALEEAIREKSVAKPHVPKNYTKKQKEIIERFRKEMLDAGGLLPHWWEDTSVYYLSEAAIKAVQEYKP